MYNTCGKPLGTAAARTSRLTCGCQAATADRISQGAAVGVTANDGTTPLHSAALAGDLHKAEFLMANGASVNAKDRDGDTPLRAAELKGNDDMVRLFRKHGGTK